MLVVWWKEGIWVLFYSSALKSDANSICHKYCKLKKIFDLVDWRHSRLDCRSVY
jgi:hypothetical protein